MFMGCSLAIGPRVIAILEKNCCGVETNWRATICFAQGRCGKRVQTGNWPWRGNCQFFVQMSKQQAKVRTQNMRRAFNTLQPPPRRAPHSSLLASCRMWGSKALCDPQVLIIMRSTKVAKITYETNAPVNECTRFRTGCTSLRARSHSNPRHSYSFSCSRTNGGTKGKVRRGHGYG